MSLSINFEPHSWYMGFAISPTDELVASNLPLPVERKRWQAYTDNGNTYNVDLVEGSSLSELKSNIRTYHLRHANGYGERI